MISSNVIVYSLSEEVELMEEPPTSAVIFNILKVIHSSPGLGNNLGNYVRYLTSFQSHIAPYLHIPWLETGMYMPECHGFHMRIFNSASYHNNSFVKTSYFSFFSHCEFFFFNEGVSQSVQCLTA